MLKESAWRLSTQMVITVLALITSVIVNRLLGPTNKGMYLVVNLTITNVLMFGNLGLGQAITYNAAKRTYALEHLWTFTMLFSLIWGLVLGLLGFMAVNLLPPQILKLDNLGKLFLALGLLGVFSQLIGSYLRSYLLGCQRFRLFNLTDIVRNGLGLFIPLIFLFLLPNKLLAMYIAGLMLPLIVMVYMITLTKEALKWRDLNFKELFVVNIKYGVKAWLANLLQFFNYRLDQFVLNYFLGATQVGLYSIAVGLGEYVWQLSNAVQTVLFPKVATVSEPKATEMTARANRNTFFFSSLMALVLGLFGYWIIYLLYGADFLPAYWGLVWLLPGIVAFSVVKILYSDLAGRGRPEIGSYITGGALIVTLVFDFWLIPRHGLVGAAQASTLAYTSAAIICTVIYVRITQVRLGILIIPQREDFRGYFNFIVHGCRMLHKKLKAVLASRRERYR